MNFYCLISLAFLVDPGYSSGRLRELLKSFEESENDLSYITVVNVDYKNNINDIIDVFSSPKIVLDIEKGANNVHFLNHRKVEQTESLRFYFSSRIMSVVFIGNTSEESADLAFEFLKFDFIRRTILVFKDDNFKGIFLENFKRFQNLIIIDDDFKGYSDNSGVSHVFDGKVVPLKTFMKDMSGDKITVNAFPYAPFCMIHYNELTKSYEYYGIISHVIQNFIDYINGTADVVHVKDFRARNISEYTPLRGANLTTFVQFLPGMNYSDNMKIFQLRSNPIEHYTIFLVFNAPRQVDSSSYPMRPLESTVWIILIIFVIYASILYTVCQKVANISHSYWTNFSMVLRSILAQSYEMEQSVVCIIVVVFGFMMTLTYSAYLGSYLTTLIFEEPLEDWPDIAKRNMTVIVAETYSTDRIRKNIPEFDRYKDYIRFVSVKAKHEIYYEGHIHPKMAIMENSAHWKYLMAPQMIFYNSEVFRRSKFSFGRSFMFIYHTYHFKYKYRLNHFLALIRETGLYQFWCSRVFFENLKYKIHPHVKVKKETAIKALKVNYFKNIFIMWSCGMALGSIAFGLEWAKKLISGFRINLIIRIEF